jgi:hypothetical protein
MTDGGPDFIVPGASRSGTTSLYYYLNEHDDIFLPETKELHFFDRNTNYLKGLDYYESQFPSTTDNRVAGEITPSYFNCGIIYERTGHDAYQWQSGDDVPERLSRAYPDIKLIITLRNPLERVHSQFWKNYRQGRERADSFVEAIRAELNGERTKETDPSCWVYRNRYPIHVGRWLDLFDNDQLKILIFERWITETDTVLNELCEFLGVDQRESWSRIYEKRNIGGEPRVVALNRLYQDYVEDTHLGRLLRKYRVTHFFDSLNSSEGYPDLSDEGRRLLSTEFRPEIDELETMIEKNLDVWRATLAGE